MGFEVDQSGKIEQTNLDTVIALTNGISFTVKLKKKDKRLIQQVFRNAGYSKLYMPVVFSAVVAICIFESKCRGAIQIDPEYVGYEKLIEYSIKQNLRKLGRKSTPVISSKRVGKESKSHFLGSIVARGKRPADKILGIDEVLRLALDNKKSGTA